jgi:ABC-type amino acid transport system permease subunit
VFGTMKATVYAMLFALPIALMAAIYTSEFVHRGVRSTVKPVIEMMESLPTVVLGFIAALVLAPLVNYVAMVGHPEESPVAPREGTVRFSPLRPRRTRFRTGDLGRGLQRLVRGEFRLIMRAVARRLGPRSG